MSSVCASCGRPADQFRDTVRVVNMRVEVVCRSCAGLAQAPAPGAPAPAPARAPAKPAATRAEVIGLGIVLLVALGSAVVFLVTRPGGSSAAAAPSAPAPRPPAGPAPRPTPGGPPPKTLAVSPSEGADFDPSGPPPEGVQALITGEWTHPLAGPFRELPQNDVQRFGAYRARDEFFKRYCGSGHCGVDLGITVGLPVIAVRDGVIEHIARTPTVLEGKFLRIKHAGTVRSYYMHLDQIAPELQLGSTVKAGQMIGTLGHTGIKNSAAHLHFMITFESKGKELYVDPEPLLVNARLVEVDPIPDWAKPTEP